MGKLFKVPGGEYLVDSEDYEIRKDEFGRPILCPLNEGGGGDQPKLYAPEIKITGDTLTIIPNTDNGAFVTGYNGYRSVNGGDFQLYGTLPSDQLELDLTAVGLPEGDFQFKATAIGTNFQDSDASNVEDYTNIFYTVKNTLTNCTSNNSATSVRKGSAYSATLTAEAGYTMNGATVAVTMGGVDITDAAYSIDASGKGNVNIEGAESDVQIIANAAEELFITWGNEQSVAGYVVPRFSANKFYRGQHTNQTSYANTIKSSTNGETWANLTGAGFIQGRLHNLFATQVGGAPIIGINTNDNYYTQYYYDESLSRWKSVSNGTGVSGQMQANPVSSGAISIGFIDGVKFAVMKDNKNTVLSTAKTSTVTRVEGDGGAFAFGKFFFPSYSGLAFITTTDGETWDEDSTSITSRIGDNSFGSFRFVYGNEKLFAYGYSSYGHYETTDGNTWQFVKEKTGATRLATNRDIIYCKGLFIEAPIPRKTYNTQSSVCKVSTDFVDWKDLDMPSLGTWTAMTAGTDSVIAYSTTSTDGDSAKISVGKILI